MSVKPAKDRQSLDSAGVLSLKILDKKLLAVGDVHTCGHHFGEFCLLSKCSTIYI